MILRLPARNAETLLLSIALSFILTAFAALSLAPAVQLADWNAAKFSAGYLASIIVWAFAAIFGHVALSRLLPRRDPILFPLVLFLCGWGLVLIWRLAPAFGLRQTIWIAVGIAATVVVALAPGDLRWLRRYRYLWLFAALGLTALTLILGTNPSGGGPALWLGCCGLYFQPSEALKLLFVVYLAAYLAEKGGPPSPAPLPQRRPASDAPLIIAKARSARSNLRSGKSDCFAPLQGARNDNTPRQTLAMLAPILLMWAFSLVLLISQRDLGTGSLIFAVFITMLYLSNGKKRYVIVGAVLLAIGGALGYFLFGVVRVRVNAWIDPFADPSGSSFQIVQSLIAVANGGLFGRGLGIGAPTVIPVVHSDFVFAAIIEEWGLIGGAAAIALIAILVLRGLRAATLARGAFGSLLAGGLAALVGLQSILIMGGVIKVLPLTGVTLPFLSYGGSSLLAHFVIVGLLLKLSDDAV